MDRRNSGKANGFRTKHIKINENEKRKMKRIYILLLIAAIILMLMACSPKTIELDCDGENCKNKVEVSFEAGKKEPDESWVVFCQDCKDNKLAY